MTTTLEQLKALARMSDGSFYVSLKDGIVVPGGAILDSNGNVIAPLPIEAIKDAIRILEEKDV